MKSILLATTAAVAMTAHCQAADIRFIRLPLPLLLTPTIVIGPVRSYRGDFPGTKVFVTLDSNGGLVAEGLNIGKPLRTEALPPSLTTSVSRLAR